MYKTLRIHTFIHICFIHIFIYIYIYIYIYIVVVVRKVIVVRVKY